MTWIDRLSDVQFVALIVLGIGVVWVMVALATPARFVHVLTGASDDPAREPTSTVEGTPYETAARRYGLAIRLDRASDSPASQSPTHTRTANSPRLVERFDRRQKERVN